MRVKIVTFYDEAMRAVGDATSAINRQYAEAHDYDFICHRIKLNTNLHASWNKLSMILGALNDCDWTFWIDADAVFVNNSKSLHDLLNNAQKPMLISAGPGLPGISEVCCGVFAIKACLWSVQFLISWLFLGNITARARERLDPIDRWEQDTFKIMLEDFSSIRDNVDIIPESIVQNPHSPFCPEALIMHYWYSGRGQYSEQILTPLNTLANLKRYTPECR